MENISIKKKKKKSQFWKKQNDLLQHLEVYTKHYMYDDSFTAKDRESESVKNIFGLLT